MTNVAGIGRVAAIVVAIVVGVITLIDLFLSELIAAGSTGGSLLAGAGDILIRWAGIVVAFALLLGFANVIRVHWYRFQTKQSGTVYSVVLLVSLLITVVVGIASGGPSGAGTQFIFQQVLQPLEATLFALLALFIATAAFRAFRIRNWETFFFVLFALMVLLGQVPISIYIWEEFPIIRDWIISVPTVAGVRGILLGVALGTIATGLRVLMGVDRPYTD